MAAMKHVNIDSLLLYNYYLYDTKRLHRVKMQSERITARRLQQIESNLNGTF